MSYERLKRYFAEVGETRVFGERVIKITELKQLIAKIEGENAESTEAEREKSVIGTHASQKRKKDAFISYKHYDEERA